MTVGQNASYTLSFKSETLAWIQNTKVKIHFDNRLYKILDQVYACTSQTQLNSDPVVNVPSPV